MRRAAICILIAIVLAGCGRSNGPPSGLDPAHQAYLKAGDLEAIVRDNEPYGDMRAGLNGVAVLKHRSESQDLFISGLNFEHIFDGEKVGESPFEPRDAAMTLTAVSDRTAVLYQPPTPEHQLESRTTITLTAPHYIDFTFECTPRADTYPRGYIGLFWASYIKSPDNLAIYAIGKGQDEPPWFSDKLRWIQHASGQHGERSTLRFVDEVRKPTFREGHEPTLYTSLARQYFAYPFYYGRSRDMVYILMFDRSDGIRLTMSPYGAGRNPDGTTNPAWDWQWFIFDPQVGQTYRYRARVVYKPWVSKADVIAEFETWTGHHVELN